MEFVYKSLMGYKPANDNNQATHVIMTVDEENSLREEINKAKIIAINYKKKFDKNNILFEEEKEKIKEYYQDEINSLQNELNALKSDLNIANNEVDNLNDLNANLKRIMRERANAKRGLTPKKVHNGYLILDCLEYNYQFRYFVGKKSQIMNYPCWKIRLQSPYDVSIPFKHAFKDIDNDLRTLFGLSLNINFKINVDKVTFEEFEQHWDSSSEENKNFIFKDSYKANTKSGFWEVEYLVKSSIFIPEDMRSAKSY